MPGHIFFEANTLILSLGAFSRAVNGNRHVASCFFVWECALPNTKPAARTGDNTNAQRANYKTLELFAFIELDRTVLQRQNKKCCSNLAAAGPYPPPPPLRTLGGVWGQTAKPWINRSLIHGNTQFRILERQLFP